VRAFYDPVRYDALAGGVPGDVEFFLSLAQEAHAAGHPVLELACGTGRVSVPVAEAGVRVVGLDVSAAMLGRAREKSAGLANVRWVEGDMRSFELPERFGLVFIPFRSFQHLLTVEDQLACLGCIQRHLVPGGRLAIDIFNPSVLMIAEWLGPKRGTIERRRDDFDDPSSGRRTKAWQTLAYRTAVQEAFASFIDEQLDDEGAVVSRVYRDLKLRYIFRYEMEHLLERAGFEIEALYGDCFRNTLEDSSPEMVWLARLPAGD
jgi:ubiquinone/menaquinone biosynthesis C-methylase UbiE